MSTTRQIDALVKLAPYLAQWTKPDVKTEAYIDYDYRTLDDMEVMLEWGKDIEIFIDYDDIIVRCLQREDCYSRQSLATWDGILPPEFVEFMDEHFRKEG